MKCFCTIALLFGVLAPACLTAAPQKDHHVILISLDGLAQFYMNDAKAQIPTLRKLAVEGASAQSMQGVFPTVTWPNHTSVVTGVSPAKHGVLGNDYFDRAKQERVVYLCDPVYDKSEIVKTPTIYDVAHQAGLTTAGVCWPATRNASTLDWTIPDMLDQALFDQFTTPSLKAECKDAGIALEMQGAWCKNRDGGKPMRDYTYTQVARHLMEKHQPNLVMLHLVGADGYQHSTGRQSPEAYYAVNDSDRHVQGLIDSVAKAGLLDKTTFIITSDHGFRTYTKVVQPNVLLKQAGLVTAVLGGKVTARRAWCMGQGGSGFVYILDEANKAGILADLKPKLAAMEGVDWVRGADEYGALGFPLPDKDARSPDLVISCKDGYAVSDTAGGEDLVAPTDGVKGTHGYDPATDDMKAIFIAWGAGIKAGAKLGEVKNVDVAPTIAKLLGVEIPGGEGRVLSEILK